MRNLLALVAVVGLVSTAACKKEEKAAETPPTTEEPKVEEEQPVVEEPVAEKPDMANKMEHCPSSVAGATTKVEGGEGVVIVTVTATDEAATTEIRTRAAYLAGLKKEAEGTDVTHSGEGTGGGALGKCPVVVGHATLAAEDVEGGTKVTMTPAEEGGLAALNTMATDRAAALATGATAPGGEHKGGDGHGHGTGTGGGGGGGKAAVDAGK